LNHVAAKVLKLILQVLLLILRSLGGNIRGKKGKEMVGLVSVL
jgi:hypothetical protein